MKNTIELSGVTLPMILARLNQADARVRKARKDIFSIFYRREGAIIEVPRDCPMPPLPSQDETPAELVAVAEKDGSTIFPARHPHTESLFYANFSLSLNATPEQYVAAIRAADRYASSEEAKGVDFNFACRSVVEAHASAQAEHAKTLAGLVACA